MGNAIKTVSHRRKRMVSITRIIYRSLRRDEQRSFNRRIMRVIEETFGADTKHYVEFKANADRFAELLSNKGYIESTSLVDLDKVADNAWTALYYQLQASMRHPREEVRLAAQTVNDVFEKIKKPINLNYDQEYGALQTLLDMLAQLDPTILAVSLVDEYVAHLAHSVDAFIKANNAVDDIKSQSMTGEIKEAANGCNNSWNALCKYIEAMAELDNECAQRAAKRLDTITSAIKTRLSMRKSTKDSANIVDEIAENA